MDKSKYIARRVIFASEGDNVSLVEGDNPHDEENMATLDLWLGLVVMLADGQSTVQQLIDHLAEQYKKGAPEDLGEIVESAVVSLLESEVLVLSDTPVELPYYLSAPAERLDLERAREAIAADGYPGK